MKPKPVRVLEDPAGARLVLVGTGGTGGYALQQLCRLLYGLKAERDERRAAPALHGGDSPGGVPDVLLCDGDTVSESNLRRQYFLSCDVGKKKALALSERYGAAYGLEIAAYPEYLVPDTDLRGLAGEGSVVVGAVDNAKSRALLHEKLSAFRDVVYVDAGNAGVALPAEDGAPTRAKRARIRDSGWEGQVLCGVRKGGETLLPFPAEQMPDLLEDDGEVLPTEVPCGQVVVSNPQRHLTNVFAATVLTGYLTTLLADGTLLHRMSLFCARSGYLRSYPALEILDEVALGA